MSTFLKLNYIHHPANYAPHVRSESLLLLNGHHYSSLSLLWALPEGIEETERATCASQLQELSQAQLRLCQGVCRGDSGLSEVASSSSRSTGCSSCCPSGMEWVAAKAAPWRTRDGRDTTCRHKEQAGQTNPFQALYSRKKWAEFGRTVLIQVDVAISWEALNIFPINNNSMLCILKSIYARSSR